MTDLEKKFEEAMFTIYRRAKDEAGYTASVFYNMLCDQGGLATAKQLINAPKESKGYTELFLRQRLDLTVEAEVVENPRWHPLFLPEELNRARERLVSHRYQFRTRAAT